jgi:predicted DNA binding CopG/RHH family protein
VGTQVLPASQEGLKMAKEIPEFKTEKEEAEFWDTHNSLEYLESDEPIELELAPELAAKDKSKTKRVTLRLRLSQIEDAKTIARDKDIPYQTLIRSWIVDAIKRERGERA